MTLAERLSLRY